MTSSLSLKKRKEMWRDWGIFNFGDPENALGGWEDHYIADGIKNCRAGFDAIPIGNPYGFKICKRRKHPNGQSMDVPKNPIEPRVWNGYNKYMADLYRPWRETQIQMYDPYNYYDRVIPNEQLLHRDDYIARPIRYDGIGVNPVHTPGPGRYNEYGFSFTPKPPMKYDVKRLHQAYPVWKQTQIYQHPELQDRLDRMDTEFMESDVVGTF